MDLWVRHFFSTLCFLSQGVFFLTKWKRKHSANDITFVIKLFAFALLASQRFASQLSIAMFCREREREREKWQHDTIPFAREMPVTHSSVDGKYKLVALTFGNCTPQKYSPSAIKSEIWCQPVGKISNCYNLVRVVGKHIWKMQRIVVAVVGGHANWMYLINGH